jgi:hypothetical protein
MKNLLLILLFSSITTEIFSQVNVYDASTIPAILKENAHSVKREEKINFEVKDISNAKLSVHQVFTVLDPEADDVLFFKQITDEFTKLDDAEIRVFDADGKQVNKYKMKDMRSQGIADGLVIDGKAYFLKIKPVSYPITIQYDYVLKYKGILRYPNYFIEDPDQSVESSQYSATVPVDLDLRFKRQYISITPSVVTSDKNKTYSWEVKNLAAIDKEEGAGKYRSLYPAILISPNKFSMSGYDGDFSSWKTFGEWYLQLTKGSLNLSDETKAFLKDLVKEAKTSKEKIAILYNYLQKNFRYVSIQLGIGGFKPWDANFVDKKKYGDCKALANYMQAILDAVGIVSYPALINAEYDQEPVDPDFPENVFNHAILCIPANKDTTWLECTSSTAEPGILGSATENRYALLITENGGVLVPTPKSKASENTLNLNTKVILKEDASGTSESMMKTKGEYREEVLNYVVNEKKDDQKEYLVRRLGFLQPDEFEINTDQKNSVAETSFKLKIEKVPEFTAGSKMFLSPRIYKIISGSLPETKKRMTPFYLPFPFIKTDTTVYQLPENYTVANLPQSWNEQFDYGKFTTKYSYDDKSNTITSVAFLQLSTNVIPADKFEDARKFFNKVIQEYTEKIVIAKK